MHIKHWTIILKNYFLVHPSFINYSVDEPDEFYVSVYLLKVVHNPPIESTELIQLITDEAELEVLVFKLFLSSLILEG